MPPGQALACHVFAWSKFLYGNTFFKIVQRMSRVCRANWFCRECADFQYVWRILAEAEQNPLSDKMHSISSVKSILKSK